MTNNAMDSVVPIKPRTYRDIKKQRKPKKEVAMTSVDAAIDNKPADTPKRKQGYAPRVSDEKIRELLAAGKSHIEIAKIYGYSRGVLRNRMKAMDIPVPDLRRGIGMQRKQRVYLLVQETVDQINELAGKTGMGKGEIIEKAVDKFVKDWEETYAGI